MPARLRENEREREDAPAAAPERGSGDGWLAGQVRVGEDGLARLQVKIGDMHCSFCVSTSSRRSRGKRASSGCRCR